jgi:hypothetical protein
MERRLLHAMKTDGQYHGLVVTGKTKPISKSDKK